MFTPNDTKTVFNTIVMPHHQNTAGNLFGGNLLAWMDECAAMCAINHAVRPNVSKAKSVVTAGIDSISFLNPAHVGDQITMECSVNYTGTTSMEIGCRVTKRNPAKYEGSVRIFSAYLTFVAFDENNTKAEVPAIKPETDEEIRRWQEARIRLKIRKRMQRGLKRKFGEWR